MPGMGQRSHQEHVTVLRTSSTWHSWLLELCSALGDGLINSIFPFLTIVCLLCSM